MSWIFSAIGLLTATGVLGPTAMDPGQTNRETNCCLVRDIARQLYRLPRSQPRL